MRHAGGRPAPLTRVGAFVSLELVGAGEALSTEEPLANEGPLAGVPAQVGPQVRRLPIYLVAARYVAHVLPTLVLATPARVRRGERFTTSFATEATVTDRMRKVGGAHGRGRTFGRHAQFVLILCFLQLRKLPEYPRVPERFLR